MYNMFNKKGDSYQSPKTEDKSTEKKKGAFDSFMDGFKTNYNQKMDEARERMAAKDGAGASLLGNESRQTAGSSGESSRSSTKKAQP